jgi:integrase
MDAGPLWQETGYVFTQADGSPVFPGTLAENFRFLTRELAMSPLTFHDLRHAFATMELQAGMNLKVVSEALGHSSVTITLDTYSHVLPNMQDELAIPVENILKRQVKST